MCFWLVPCPLWSTTRLSILGRLLFILYTNDLLSVVSSPMKIFADDDTIYCSVTSKADCKAFQKELDLVSSWCSTWQMRLNPSKCKLLCIFNKRSSIHHSYYLNNHLLQYVLSAKYLGVIIDAKLSWNKHVSYISSKAARKLNLLLRGSTNKNKK